MNSSNNFYVRHPKFRTFTDRLYTIWDWAVLVSNVVSIIIIISFVLALYFLLPEDLATPVAAIAGGVLTLVVFPMFLNSINKRSDAQRAQFDRMHDFYIELTKNIVNALKKDENEDLQKLSLFIEENYPIICVDLPEKLRISVLDLKRECDYKLSVNMQTKFDRKNVLFFSEKCLRFIRKQGMIDGGFYFSNSLTTKEENTP